MKTISFIIPVYNEEKRIDKTIRALKKLKMPYGLILEKMIFVDDGSSDSTLSRLYGAKPGLEKKIRATVKIVSYMKNIGKGYAVSVGMKESDSDYSLFFDADMSTDISELKKFMPHLRRGIPIVIGTRKNGHSTVIRHQPMLRELLGKGFTLLSNIILNTWVTDFTCGFKAFSKEAKNVIFPKIKINSWGFDAESIFLGRITGFEFAEVPVIWTDDRRSKVKIWRDMPIAFIDLFYIRLLEHFNVYDLGRFHPVPKPAHAFLKVLKTYMF